MARSEQVKIDDALNKDDFDVEANNSGNGNEDQLSYIAEIIKKQNEIIAEQQKKIEEQDKKINDIIGVITAFLQSGGAVGFGQAGASQDESGFENIGDQDKDTEPDKSVVSAQNQNKAVINQQQTPFNMDRITELLRSIAIITSNIGGPKEPPNPVGSIHDAISIASSIAGALGEGLARVFDAFNQMEERAFKSYAARFKSIKFDDADIEKAVERAIEKKLKFLVKEEKQGG